MEGASYRARFSFLAGLTMAASITTAMCSGRRSRVRRRSARGSVPFLTGGDEAVKSGKAGDMLTKRGIVVVESLVPPNALRRLRDAGVGQSSPADGKAQEVSFAQACAPFLLDRAKSLGLASLAEAAERSPGRCGHSGFVQSSNGRFHYMPSLGDRTRPSKSKGSNDAAIAGEDELIAAMRAVEPCWMPMVEHFLRSQRQEAEGGGADSSSRIYCSERQVLVSLAGSADQPFHADNTRGGVTVIVPLCDLRADPRLGATQLLLGSENFTRNVPVRPFQRTREVWERRSSEGAPR